MSSTFYTHILAFTTAIFCLNGCAPNHPTLDDFIIEDDAFLYEETQDLINDESGALEAETDAEGALVTSKNPSTLLVKQSNLPIIHNLPATNGPIRHTFNPNKIANHLMGTATPDENHRPELDAYQASVKDMYASYESKNLSKMRKWRDQALTSVPKPEEVLFYPFSGPDVVNMLTFFPGQHNYVMMGLEYVGTEQTISEWSKPLDKNHMDTLQKSVESVFLRSFFRTLNMSSDFSKNGTRGVLPGMLLMLKLMNMEILDVQWVTLNPEGKLQYLSAHESNASHKNFGVELTIQQKHLPHPQRIYYFRTDLSDENLSKNVPLSKFINTSLGKTMTLVKSASFLMHMKEFRTMRQSLLTTSRAILQDDSGVPFKFFPTTQWEHRLFGRYTGPYGESFAHFQQPEVHKAFEQAYPELLEFHFGYGYAKIPSHLMLFIRKDLPSKN